MKKLLSIFLAMTMAVSAFACTFAVSAETTGINFNDGDKSMVTIVGDATAEIENGQLKVYWEKEWASNLNETNYARIAVDTTGLTNLTFDAYLAKGTGWEGTDIGAHFGVEIDGTVYWDTGYNNGHIKGITSTNYEIFDRKMYEIPEGGTFVTASFDENIFKKMTAEDIAKIEAICIRPGNNMAAQFTYVDNISAPAPSSGNTGEIKFNAQVALDDSIDLSILPEVESTEGVTATFTVDGKVVSEGVEAVEGKYTYPCVNPGEMGKDVTVELYKEGALIGTTTTSVAAYLKTLIADETQNSQTKDLAFATLEYGAAAQKYLGGDEADLVTNEVEYTYSNPKLPVDRYTNNYNKPEQFVNVGANITAAWLNLSNSIAIKFKVETTESVDNIYLKVEGAQNSEVPLIQGEQKQGYIEFTFDKLNPGQGGEAFRFTVCNNSGEQISEYITYSVESYAARMYNKITNENMKSLIAATMNYCFFAELYAKNQ